MADARRLLPVALAGLAALAAACSHGEKKREPVEAPHVATRVRYQLGNPLRGPDALAVPLEGEDLEAANALALEVDVLALAAPLASTVPSVVEAARLVVREGAGGQPLGAAPGALADAWAGPVADADALLARARASDPPPRPLRTVRAVILPGATTVVELFRDEPLPPDASSLDAGRARASLLLGRAHGEDALVPALEWDDAGNAPPELVALEPAPLVRGTATWAAIVPSPFGEGARDLLFVARVTPAPAAAAPGAAVHEEEVALAARSLAAQAAQAARIERPAAPPSPIPDLVATRHALEDRATARRALYTLALATGARTAEEIAVSVEDQSFAPIASGVAAALAGAVRSGATAPEVGLAVEKATLASCRDLLATEDAPDDLSAALERRGGAAFLLLGSVQGELEKARTLDELEKQIEAQNLALLEDASPVVRVHAARWLGARRDLEGFQPLAPASERRAALQKIKARKPGSGGP